MNVDAKDCQLTSAMMAEQTAPLIEIDSTIVSMRFRTTERTKLESDLSGKRVKTKIFFEKFMDLGSSRRMLDANSDFFCDVNQTDLATFPSNKGQYAVEGIFVVIDGKPGLSRCNIAK